MDRKELFKAFMDMINGMLARGSFHNVAECHKLLNMVEMFAKEFDKLDELEKKLAEIEDRTSNPVEEEDRQPVVAT